MKEIRFNEPFVTGGEIKYLEEVVASGSFAGNGEFSKRAQSLLAERYQVPHVLLTHSCTAALEITALVYDLGPGDEVILPSYTFVSTASAFLRTGAKLVFCEIDPATMTVDVADIANRITDRTRVIAPIHYAGVGADMTALEKLAAERNVHLVEDAAQGLDATHNGRALGTIGELASFSFHETKNLHCGLGGALFINNPDLFDKAEDIWERGTNRTKMFRGLVDKYRWVELGSSFYPTEFQAAFLLSQLEHIDDCTAGRRPIFETYRQRLEPLVDRGLLSLQTLNPENKHNYHACFAKFNTPEDCERVRLHLVSKKIHAYIGYVPLHSSPMGRQLGYQACDLPITEEYSQRVLRFPLHHRMEADDAHRIVDEIESVL